jgi:hypothetical protein
MRDFIKYLLRQSNLPEEWDYILDVIKNLYTLYWFKFYIVLTLVFIFLGLNGAFKEIIEFIASIMHIFVWKWPTLGFVLCLIFILKEDVY